jgi:hypothetical protein
LIITDDTRAESVRTVVHYYQQNLGWVAVPEAFIDGTVVTRIPADPSVRVARPSAFRLPASPFEPSFEEFHPFS